MRSRPFLILVIFPGIGDRQAFVQNCTSKVVFATFSNGFMTMVACLPPESLV
jgi:hypothetical protein